MKKWVILTLIVVSCTQVRNEKTLDIQGHRGARGLLPENTIEGFKKAALLGVTTLELDLVVTKDSQILVSHEPFFSSEFCLDTLDQRIEESKMFDYNIFEMTYAETQAFDCGSIPHPRFPEQLKRPSKKPLLKDVFHAIEEMTSRDGGRLLNYNIELKTRKEWDNQFHPIPQVFSDLVYDLVSEAGLWERVNIQSFDFRTLQYFNNRYPEVKLALLIENDLDWEQNVDSLGFTPHIYSCYYELLSREIIADLQQSKMLVIPWTVNDEKAMQQMIDWGVDGIITDYPDMAVEITK